MAGPTECLGLLVLLVGLSCGKPVQDEIMELRMPDVQPLKVNNSLFLQLHVECKYQVFERDISLYMQTLHNGYIL